MTSVDAKLDTFIRRYFEFGAFNALVNEAINNKGDVTITPTGSKDVYRWPATSSFSFTQSEDLGKGTKVKVSVKKWYAKFSDFVNDFYVDASGKTSDRRDHTKVGWSYRKTITKVLGENVVNQILPADNASDFHSSYSNTRDTPFTVDDVFNRANENKRINKIRAEVSQTFTNAGYDKDDIERIIPPVPPEYNTASVPAVPSAVSSALPAPPAASSALPAPPAPSTRNDSEVDALRAQLAQKDRDVEELRQKFATLNAQLTQSEDARIELIKASTKLVDDTKKQIETQERLHKEQLKQQKEEYEKNIQKTLAEQNRRYMEQLENQKNEYQAEVNRAHQSYEANTKILFDTNTALHNQVKELNNKVKPLETRIEELAKNHDELVEGHTGSVANWDEFKGKQGVMLVAYEGLRTTDMVALEGENIADVVNAWNQRDEY